MRPRTVEKALGAALVEFGPIGIVAALVILADLVA